MTAHKRRDAVTSSPLLLVILDCASMHFLNISGETTLLAMTKSCRRSAAAICLPIMAVIKDMPIMKDTTMVWSSFISSKC